MTQNYIFVILIWSICFKFLRNSSPTILLPLLVVNGSFKIKNIIALHNTLFIYHPILLYMCIIILFFDFFFKKTRFCFIMCMWFSFILGGYWSSQEFNWGGWWNWDSLEMGILLILLIISLLAHLKFNKYINFYFLQLTILLVINYWMLNKLGLTISIHSFIKNPNIYKYLYILLICISWFNIGLNNLINFILIFYITNMFLSVYTLKLLTLYIVVATNYYWFFKKKIYLFTHNLIYTIIYCFIGINIFNITYYKNKKLNFYWINLNFTQSLAQINVKQFYINGLNNLYKEFFFYKFHNYNNLTINWFFSLKNIFSSSHWFLLLQC